MNNFLFRCLGGSDDLKLPAHTYRNPDYVSRNSKIQVMRLPPACCIIYLQKKGRCSSDIIIHLDYIINGARQSLKSLFTPGCRASRKNYCVMPETDAFPF